MYNYVNNRQKKQSIDILVMCLDEIDFHVMMNSSGPKILLLIKMPSFFRSKNCISMADSSLNTNTSKVVAFQDAVEKVNRENYHEMDIWGPPQCIKFSFKCNTNIPAEYLNDGFESWKIHQAAHSSIEDESSHTQFHIVLSIKLESVDKPCKVSSVKKGMRLFSCPSL